MLKMLENAGNAEKCWRMLKMLQNAENVGGFIWAIVATRSLRDEDSKHVSLPTYLVMLHEKNVRGNS
jgi:hypothetical protein